MQSQNGQLTGVLMRLLRIGLGSAGLVSLATGAWMLASPEGWYTTFPAGVTDIAPFNAHFVRDLGGWYAAGGVLLLFALSNPMRFGGVVLIATLISYVAHSVTHVIDLIDGALPASHWLIDIPFVFLPVVLLALLTWIWWTLQSGRHPELNREVNAEEPGG